MKIIQPQTRTIFIEFFLVDLTLHTIEKYKGKIDNYSSTTIFKFKLNLPKMALHVEDEINAYLHPLNENDQLCHSPLLNTNTENRICLNIRSTNYDEILDKIYNSTYNLDSFSSVYNYYLNNFHNVTQILELYQNWQDNGKINLVPVQNAFLLDNFNRQFKDNIND